MGYTELGRKRPIEIQGDFYDKILIYRHKGEVCGVCYMGGEIDGVYNYTKKRFPLGGNCWNDIERNC